MAKSYSRAELEALLGNPNVRKMLDLISYTEGTQANGYYTTFGGGDSRPLPPTRTAESPLSRQTVSPTSVVPQGVISSSRERGTA